MRVKVVQVFLIVFMGFMIGWYGVRWEQEGGRVRAVVLPDTCFNVEIKDTSSRLWMVGSPPWERGDGIWGGIWQERHKGIIVQEYRWWEVTGGARKHYVANSRWEVEFAMLGGDTEWIRVVYGGKSQQEGFYICWYNGAVDTIEGRGMYRWEPGEWTRWVVSNIPEEYIRQMFPEMRGKVIEYQPERINWVGGIRMEEGIEAAIPGIMGRVEAEMQRRGGR